MLEYLQCKLSSDQLSDTVVLADWSSVLGYQVDAAVISAIGSNYGNIVGNLILQRAMRCRPTLDITDELVTYAHTIGISEIIVYDPTNLEYLAKFSGNIRGVNFLRVNNCVQITAGNSIPLLLCGLGMSMHFGSGRQAMLTCSRKILYYTNEVYTVDSRVIDIESDVNNTR